MKVSDYLPGFENGVFISYAHLDKDWVDTFVERLSASLKRLIGVEEAGLIWKDDRLWVGERLSDELADSISGSAILLIVLTPGWINSHYCHAELTHFESTLRDPENQRICIVEALPPTDGQELPPALLRHFSNHVHVKFYASEADSGQLEPFDNPNRKPYAKALSAVACSLREGLAAVRRGREAEAEASKLPPVVLAEATDDLAERREDVRVFLEGAGVDVLPLGSYFTRLDGFERAFGADLSEAALLVQLLGRYAGRTLPGSQEPFVTLQHRLAHSRHLPILQWRPGDLDLKEIGAEAMRALLEGATVRGGTLESFKQEVLRSLEALARRGVAPVIEATEVAPAAGQDESAAKAAEPETGDALPFVFINSDRRDKPVAEFLCDELANHVLADMPIDIDDPGEIDADRSDKIRECDGMVLVYGATPLRWVNSQLLQFSKLAPRRGGRSKPVWIYEAPPEEKAPITLRSPVLSYETVGSRKELSRDFVGKILERLRA